MESIGKLIADSDYRALSGRLGLIAIVPLIVLLIERELFRAYVPDPDRHFGAHWMTVVIVPLLGALALILAVRLLELLGHK